MLDFINGKWKRNLTILALVYFFFMTIMTPYLNFPDVSQILIGNFIPLTSIIGVIGAIGAYWVYHREV